MHLHDVADRNLREASAVGDARFRVDGGGPRRAHASAEDVGANDEVAPRVDAAAVADHVVPPARRAPRIGMLAGDVRVARQGMADENHIIPRRIERAAHFVGNVNLFEGTAIFERKPFRRQLEAQGLGFGYKGHRLF